MRWRLRIWPGVLALAACAATDTGPVLRWSAPARGPKTTDASVPAGGAYDREIAARFAAARTEARDRTFAPRALLEEGAGRAGPDRRRAGDLPADGAGRRRLRTTSSRRTIA